MLVLSLQLSFGQQKSNSNFDSSADRSQSSTLRGDAITGDACQPCNRQTCSPFLAVEPSELSAGCPSMPSCAACPACSLAADTKITCGVDSLSLASSATVTLRSLDEFRPALSSGGRVHAVAITSGNKAMNKMIRNWATAVRQVRPALPFVVAGLDKEGHDELAQAGYVNLYVDDSAHRSFGSTSSFYGDSKYADMSAFKWRWAADLLDRGVPVLLADPDVVILRNPVSYVDTLPACDVYMQMDVDWVTTGASSGFPRYPFFCFRVCPKTHVMPCLKQPRPPPPICRFYHPREERLGVRWHAQLLLRRLRVPVSHKWHTGAHAHLPRDCGPYAGGGPQDRGAERVEPHDAG